MSGDLKWGLAAIALLISVAGLGGVWRLGQGGPASEQPVLVARSPATDVDHWERDWREAFPHGSVQVTRMIADRPDMGFRTPRPVLWWAAQCFEGSDYPIWWGASVPSRGASAEMTYPADGQRATIRIRPLGRGDTEAQVLLNFNRLWSSAVFELLNHESWKDFDALQSNPGRHTRVEYVRGMTRIEHGTALKTKRFFHEIWVPWSDSVGLLPISSAWQRYVPTDFDEWFASLDDPGEYPWIYYGTEWDQVARGRR
jgi:hypothetical protein